MILALEFSSNRRSVAIADGKDVLARVETDDVKRPPLTLIDEALKKASLNRTAIETISIGIGPGSYTGIRSAIATAANATPLERAAFRRGSGGGC